MAYAAEEDDVIGIAEYGSLNSLSSSLVPHITAHFSSSSEGNTPSFTVTYSDGPGSDFRSLMRQVDSTSYEYPYHHLNSNVYSSFAARPFPVQVVPPRSITVGFSLMDLHCRRTPSSIGLSAAAAAHNELQAFLNTRAQEIKKGGLLLLAFIQRQEDESIAAVAAAKSKRAGDQESPEEPSFTSPIAAHLHGPLNHLATTQEKKITSFKSHLPATLPVSFPPANVSSSLNSSLQTLSTSAESASTSASLLGSSASSSMSRRRSESSPCRPCFKTDSAAKRTDVWSTIPALLAPCIQRLVSTGLIKSDTASHLLTVSSSGLDAARFA